MDWKIFLAAPLAAALMVASATPLSPLNGWAASSSAFHGKTYAQGSAPPSKSYTMGLDSQVQFQGQSSLSVQSLPENPLKGKSHGAMMKYAYGYEGRRVRFTGWMRSADVEGWAGAFLRVEPEGMKRLFAARHQPEDLPFGAGESSAIGGWTQVSLVADVPNTPGTVLSMGAMVVGQGKVWLSAMQFEEVGREVPLTPARVGMPLSTAAEHQADLERKPFRPTSPRPPNLSLE